MKNFKKFISIIIAIMMLVSTFSLPASAYSWTDPGIQTVDEAVREYELFMREEVETYRYYFLMPNGHNGDLGDDDSVDRYGEPLGHPGEYAPTWYKDLPDGTPATNTAGIYWWDAGVADPPSWIGYLPSGKDENDPDVYYADVPTAVTGLIWNNGVDGGMDCDDPIYYCCAQSVNIPCEYYDPGESPNYPDGTESFDNMIFVVDPDLISINEFSNKQTCGGEWYYYYGNGCYGFTENGDHTDCLRNDHFDAKGNHVGTSSVEPTVAPTYPTTVEPTEAVTVEPTAPALYDGASFSVKVESGKATRLPFTPATSGYYEIRSNATSGDPKCTLYDSNGSSMAYSDDYSGSNFYINYYLQKGKTYYYEISNYYNTSMVCPITFKYVNYPYIEPSEYPTVAPTDWYEPTESPYYPTEAPYYPTESPYNPMKPGDVINFDANSAGWKNFKKVFCHIWAYGGDSFYAWQSKASACTDADGDGIWTYDLYAKGVCIEPGVLYAVIFSNENQLQTYNLLFDSGVIGDTAYCDGTTYENPEDSSKTAQAAFWRCQDPTVYGPEKCITSIGNVVGTCIPRTTSAQSMFEDFLINKLENARTYSGKDDQTLLDDTAKALGLRKGNVEDAIYYTGVRVYWSASKSTLESGTNQDVTERPDPSPNPGGNASDDQIPRPEKPAVPTPDIPHYSMTSGNVIHFDANSAGWRNFKKVFCHIWVYGGDSFYAWQQKAEACTDTDGDGIWTYDLAAKGIYLEPGVSYAVIFSNENQMQTYDLLFDASCVGDTACCDDTYYENAWDSSKTVQAAFWCNQDPLEFGPVMYITYTGNIVGVCIPNTTSPMAMFEEFLDYNLDSARVYSDKSDQRILDDIAYVLDLDVDDVEQAIRNTRTNTSWNAKYSYLEGKPTYVEDVPAVPKDKLKYELNVKADTIWGSYADRIYCHIFCEDEGFSFYNKGDANEQCIKNSDGTWTYNLKDNGITLEEGVTYQVVFYSTLPTVPSTPVMNINTTYLDYTLLYEFSDNAYKWEYTGDLSGDDNGGNNGDDNGGETDPDDNKLMGDLDGDGVVSILDATAIQRHIAKLKLLTDEQMILAELDGDGVISVMDATAIQRKIAKLD